MMIRCTEGHFYDPAKHTACPWCGVAAAGAAAAAGDPAEGKTQPLRPIDRPSPGGGAVESGATKALHRTPAGLSPVVGWLVCVDGPDRGRDYRIHMEKNFIGRATGMDIAITGDDSISRDKHATIIFDPKKQVFWLLPGDSSGLVYLNESLINTPTEIHADDVIELGGTKLVMVPFQSKKFNWSDLKEEKA